VVVVAEGEPITKTVTDAVVRWNRGFSWEELKGKGIRRNPIGFELRDAQPYSFAFAD
jgi:hypothetical protein